MELQIVKFFNKLGSGWINKVTDYICRLSPFIIFWITLASLFLAFDLVRGADIFLGFFIALAFQFLITEGLLKGKLIKFWNGRKRPYLISSEIKPIGERRIDSSFPSSHLAITTLFFIVVLFHYSFFWPAALASIIIIGYARLHNGMHYPSDAIAGIILGIIYGWAGIYIASKILQLNNF